MMKIVNKLQSEANNQTYYELRLLDHDDQLIGLLEYSLDDKVLHINNLINKYPERYKGVGTALMNEAVKISMDKRVGFSFEIAKGSELFYQTWIPRAFHEDKENVKTKNFFERIHSGICSKLTSKGFSYSHDQLKKYCSIERERNYEDDVKEKSPLNNKI